MLQTISSSDVMRELKRWIFSPVNEEVPVKISESFGSNAASNARAWLSTTRRVAGWVVMSWISSPNLWMLGRIAFRDARYCSLVRNAMTVPPSLRCCLLYTSDAADEEDSVDL